MDYQPDRRADASDGLNSADWRDLGSPAPSTPDARPLGRPARVRDTYHLKDRAAGAVRERERATEIVSSARGVVKSAFDDIRFGRRIDVAELLPVVAAIAASVARNPLALPSVTRLKERHEYTYLHSIAVCGLMVGLARELELPAELVHEIGLGGLLHDVGKAVVPLKLLDKPGPLDLEEYALVQQHTLRGHELLIASGIESPIALDVCLHHHERVDGSGYPTGMSAPTLSIHARMGAVCDVYDAVTSTRTYKERWSPGAALDWMASAAGQFDRRVFRTFRKLIGVFPIGTLVRLASQRLGIVVGTGADDERSPDVCVFFSADLDREIAPRVIPTANDPIVGIEASQSWAFPDWEQRQAALLAQFGNG